MSHPLAQISLALVLLATLCGCVGGEGPTAFDRPATDDDALPAAVVLDVAESRFVGTFEGSAIYLAVPKTESGICIVAVYDEPQGAAGWGGAGCGSKQTVGFSLTGLGTFQYGMDSPQDEGWELLGDDVYVLAPSD